MEYKEYEKEVEKNSKKNEVYLEKFVDMLEKNMLSEKTIRTHISNVDFYINVFLIKYEVLTMDKGCYHISEYLGDWFIRKAMWSSAENIKKAAASIKKFYKCMLDNSYIEAEDYAELCRTIKDEMQRWQSNIKKYEDSMEEYY